MRYAMLAFDVLIAISYSFTFSVVLAGLPVPTRAGMILGAGSLAYLMTATAVIALHFLLNLIRRRLDVDTNPARRRVLNVAGNAILATPFAVMGYGALVQRTNFRVRELDLPIPGLPQDLDGLRILHLSDIHLSAFLSEAEFARAIDASLELR